MDASRFDAVARSVGALSTRRVITHLLGTGAVAAVIAPALGGANDAAGKRRKKKVTLCFEGQTIKKPKKQKKKLIKRGATAGACSDCTPDCVGTCGCPAGSFCNSVTCVPCAATLPSIVPAGTIQLCPGIYNGPFTINAATTLTGAGNGADPATSTILQGDGISSVVTFNGADAAKLVNVRVTGGGGADGGGVRVIAAASTIEDCVITGNTVSNIGGGIVCSAGIVTVDGCEIFSNEAKSGGGIASQSLDGVTIADTIIRNNEASGPGGGFNGLGGGILVVGGVVTLDATVTITQNTAATAGGGVALIFAGALTQGGATITGNTAPLNPQCDDVGAPC